MVSRYMWLQSYGGAELMAILKGVQVPGEFGAIAIVEDLHDSLRGGGVTMSPCPRVLRSQLSIKSRFPPAAHRASKRDTSGSTALTCSQPMGLHPAL